MKHLGLCAIPLLLAGQPAMAASGSTDGNAALALAALVAQHTPNTLVSNAHKALLAQYLAGHSNAPHPAGTTIHFTTGALVCAAGNVDITHHRCTLALGSTHPTLTGRQAHELYATFAEAGVASDGAAGTLFESVTHLTCTIKADDVKANGGGGAHCDYTQ